MHSSRHESSVRVDRAYNKPWVSVMSNAKHLDVDSVRYWKAMYVIRLAASMSGIKRTRGNCVC
ncbi:unnamed protein product [Periconia digitata]|uniref:Uncharacterized protein n=1 Tax=Periconia digitata TaxID=1303443 RepID=A0A9W4XYU6_9PLEO|nr:unnamed protein product [Periconia digitata]